MIPDLIGLLGVALYVGSYILIQLRREFAKHIMYSVMNFVGAALVAISLLYSWNMASMVTQVFWMVISLFGIYRCLVYLKQGKSQPDLIPPETPNP